MFPCKFLVNENIHTKILYTFFPSFRPQHLNGSVKGSVEYNCVEFIHNRIRTILDSRSLVPCQRELPRVLHLALRPSSDYC